MYTLISNLSADKYIDDLNELPDHHICKILDANSSISLISYRDSRDNKDQLFFDNIDKKETSDIYISRYDDLDCLRFDDNTIIQF